MYLNDEFDGNSTINYSLNYAHVDYCFKALKVIWFDFFQFIFFYKKIKHLELLAKERSSARERQDELESYARGKDSEIGIC